MGFWYLWWHFYDDPTYILSVDEMLVVHTIKKSFRALGHFYLSFFPGLAKLVNGPIMEKGFTSIVNGPSSIKKWKEKWFYVSGNWLMTTTERAPYSDVPM